MATTYQEAGTAPGREFRNTVIVEQGGLTETYTTADIDISYSFTDGKGYTIGKVCSAEAKIKLYEPLKTLNYYQATYKVSSALLVDNVWVDRPIGVFYAYEVSTEDEYATINIVAYDKLMKLDVPYVPAINSTPPYSRTQILQDIGNQYGFSVNPSAWRINDYVIPGFTQLLKANEQLNYQVGYVWEEMGRRGDETWTARWALRNPLHYGQMRFDGGDIAITPINAVQISPNSMRTLNPITLESGHKYALFFQGHWLNWALSGYAVQLGWDTYDADEIFELRDTQGNVITPIASVKEENMEYISHMLNDEDGYGCIVYEGTGENAGEIWATLVADNGSYPNIRFDIYPALIDVTDILGNSSPSSIINIFKSKHILEQWGTMMYNNGYHAPVYKGKWVDEIVLPSTVRETLGWLGGVGGHNVMIQCPSTEGDFTEQLIIQNFWMSSPSSWNYTRANIVEDGLKTEGMYHVSSLTTGTTENPIIIGSGKGIVSYNPYITQEDAQYIFNRISSKEYMVGEVSLYTFPKQDFGEVIYNIYPDSETTTGTTYPMIGMDVEMNLSGGCIVKAISYGNYDTEIELEEDTPKLERVLTQKTQLEMIWDKLKELDARVAALEG